MFSLSYFISHGKRVLFFFFFLLSLRRENINTFNISPGNKETRHWIPIAR